MVFLSDSSQEQLEFVTTNAVPDVSVCVSTEDCVLKCVLLTNDALIVRGGVWCAVCRSCVVGPTEGWEGGNCAQA